MFVQSDEAQIFEKGDQVKIGSGKVQYTVWANQLTTKVQIESNNTGKVTEIESSRLNLVRNVRLLPETPGSVQIAGEPAPAEDEDGGSETGGNPEDAAMERRNARSVGFGHLIKAEAPVQERGSYSKLVLGALQLLPALYMGTVSNKVKSSRRAKNKVARASRKANR